MKVIAELELIGDFGDNLPEDEVVYMITETFQSGAESFCCDGKVKVIKVLER